MDAIDQRIAKYQKNTVPMFTDYKKHNKQVKYLNM